MAVEIKESVDQYGKAQWTITSPKFKESFVVHKTIDGHAMYGIKMTKGSTADKLGGWYMSSEAAIQAVKLYCIQAKDSVTVRRDKTYKENHPDDSSTKPNKKVNIRKGSSD